MVRMRCKRFYKLENVEPSKMYRPKIGAVSYLNTKPLVTSLEEIAPDFDLVFDLPSRLADRLAASELAVALIPVVEAVSSGYTIVSDACIACHGPVRSVKLFSRVAGEYINTLALDEGSRTSCILSQILLANQFGVRPKTIPLPIDADWRASPADAVLVIGDRAMKVDDHGFEFSWDLGEQWFRQTGLPFVFAVWAARPITCLGELDWILTTCRDAGLEQLDRIAASHAANYGLSREDCFDYLNRHLHFQLGAQEKKGAQLFFEEAGKLNLMKRLSLNFYECSTT